MLLVLCDINPEMVRAWADLFGDCPDVEVRLGDLTDVEADAYVSPANSFGDMSGGIDFALRERFGARIEDAVRERIDRAGGILPVGQAIVVETGDEEVPYLISSPTMEVPTDVAHTHNAYYAMRALLRAVQRFNARNPGAIETVAIPGLCTGVGHMLPETAARQMRDAYDSFTAEVPSG